MVQQEPAVVLEGGIVQQTGGQAAVQHTAHSACQRNALKEFGCQQFFRQLAGYPVRSVPDSA